MKLTKYKDFFCGPKISILKLNLNSAKLMVFSSINTLATRVAT